MIAHGKVEPAVWDFINGGTESEVTLRRNRHGLDRLAFRPRVLSDVARIDTSTTFLRHKLALPGSLMAPVGSLALIDPAAAVSVAGACKTFDRCSSTAPSPIPRSTWCARKSIIH